MRTPIFGEIFHSVEGVRRLEEVGFSEGRIKGDDVQCHLSPVVLWLSKGLAFHPARCKKTGRGDNIPQREDGGQILAHRGHVAANFCSSPIITAELRHYVGSKWCRAGR